MSGPPEFDDAFRARLADLLAWRRDVREFRPDPLPEAVLDALLTQAARAPSVGNSQPTRFVLVRSAECRHALTEHVGKEAIAAGRAYTDEQRAQYLQLKLHGLRECPVVIAVFCVDDPPEGRGLGRQTVPEALIYSTVCAIHTLWLAARAEGIGMGWVSILRPERIAHLLQAPPDWTLVALLCLGYPEIEADLPTLHTQGWQSRLPLEAMVIER